MEGRWAGIPRVVPLFRAFNYYFFYKVVKSQFYPSFIKEKRPKYPRFKMVLHYPFLKEISFSKFGMQY